MHMDIREVFIVISSFSYGFDSNSFLWHKYSLLRAVCQPCFAPYPEKRGRKGQKGDCIRPDIEKPRDNCYNVVMKAVNKAVVSRQLNIEEGYHGSGGFFCD